MNVCPWGKFNPRLCHKTYIHYLEPVTFSRCSRLFQIETDTSALFLKQTDVWLRQKQSVWTQMSLLCHCYLREIAHQDCGTSSSATPHRTPCLIRITKHRDITASWGRRRRTQPLLFITILPSWCLSLQRISLWLELVPEPGPICPTVCCTVRVSRNRWIRELLLQACQMAATGNSDDAWC